VQFSSSNYSVQEDCTTVTIIVNRVSDTSGVASVDYASSDATASERSDYIKAVGALRFAAGETSRSFAVLINGDSYVEGNEAFSITLNNPQRRDVRELARALDEKLMRPLRALTGDATQLLVSPGGELNLLPFQALIDEQNRYLVERYAFTYLTSGRDLLRLQVARESKSAPLVIANPAFGDSAPGQKTNAAMKDQKVNAGAKEQNAQTTTKGQTAKAATILAGPKARRGSVTGARSLSELYFPPLGGTAEEADAIRKLFPDAHLLSGEGALPKSNWGASPSRNRNVPASRMRAHRSEQHPVRPTTERRAKIPPLRKATFRPIPTRRPSTTPT
jgi:hypothetical protein